MGHLRHVINEIRPWLLKAALITRPVHTHLNVYFSVKGMMIIVSFPAER